MAARLCPHCKVVSNFTGHEQRKARWGRGDQQFEVFAKHFACQNCGGLVTIYDKTGEQAEAEWVVFPSVVPEVDESVPANISEDFIEGVQCLNIGANKATVTMFRRTLELIADDKEAEGGRLVDKIESLSTKKIIPEDLVLIANEIRFLGNYGAHPSDDGLDEISSDEAEDIKDFIEHLFNWLYVMPSQAATAKARRLGENQ